MDSKVVVNTPDAPEALGPYSQAVGFNGLLFCSGQIPLDPESGELVQGGVKAQTARVMANLAAVLDARGLDFDHVLRTTIYMANMNDYAQVNEIYGRFFDRNPPARAAVEVSRLPKNVLVEITMIAAVPEAAPAPTKSAAPEEAADDADADEGADEAENSDRSEEDAAEQSAEGRSDEE